MKYAIALVVLLIVFGFGHSCGYHDGVCDLARSIAGPEISSQTCKPWRPY